MKTINSSNGRPGFFAMAALIMLLGAGCQTASEKGPNQPATTVVAPAETPAPAQPAMTETAATAQPVATPLALPIRIDAGASDGFTDSSGEHWLPDQGFTDGDTVERPDLAITNAADPEIYHTERYSMTAFTEAVPNGKYLVKLHFCETFEGITGPGQRVFSFDVAGHEFKDFDVWEKAGGPQRAYVETVPVDITDGKLEITFTPNIENPQINGIEIIPATP